MSTDIFYGADCELRVGAMADAVTDPTQWFNLEFVSLNANPTRDRNDRPKLGIARNNTLDPIKPIAGFERLAMDVVLDGDTRQFAFWLLLGVGLPATTGPVSGLYTHRWASGSKTPALFALQLRTASGEVRLYRGLTIGQIAMSASGEQTQNFNITLSLRGLSRARVADFLTGTLFAGPTAAPAYRALFKVDAANAANVLSASWNWDRQLAEDIFLSPAPTLSGIHPNGGAHSGQAQFRAVGAPYDAMEETDQVFNAQVALTGTVTGHYILFEHLNCLFAAAPLAVSGPGQVERTFAWNGHQTASSPASRITMVNDRVSYV